MFAIKTLAKATLPLCALLAAAPAALANSAQEPTIPVTVDLGEVEARPGPLYISIQKEAEYMGMRGAGGIIQAVGEGTDAITYKVDVPGRYAVSLWHDLNDDTVFSMDESYTVLDGWGASGNIDPSRRPVFDDVAIDVPAHGADVTVTMFYPD